MNPLDPVNAVRRIDTNRATAYAFEIVGHMSTADIENLYGLMEGAYALHDRIDLLIRIVDFDGIDWDDSATETASEARASGTERIRHCALIGDREAIGAISSLFPPRSSGERRDFAATEEDGAWAWIGARPEPT